MAISMQIQRQFDALHRDAQRVLSSLDHLSQGIDRENSPSTKTAPSPQSSANIQVLRENLNVLRQKVEDTSRALSRGAKQLDSQVRSQPYPYIAGAVGVGALAALLIERRLLHRR